MVMNEEIRKDPTKFIGPCNWCEQPVYEGIGDHIRKMEPEHDSSGYNQAVVYHEPCWTWGKALDVGMIGWDKPGPGTLTDRERIESYHQIDVGKDLSLQGWEGVIGRFKHGKTPSGERDPS